MRTEPCASVPLLRTCGPTLPASPMDFDPCQHLVHFFETLTPQTLEHLDAYYTLEAYFKDPFNEVHALEDIRAIFQHMFATLDGPRFIVHERIVQGQQCFLVWTFEFRLRRRAAARAEPWRIQGGSHLRFAPDGRVCYHRDYWDAAEELYEKLPVLGALMRWLRRRMAT